MFNANSTERPRLEEVLDDVRNKTVSKLRCRNEPRSHSGDPRRHALRFDSFSTRFDGSRRHPTTLPMYRYIIDLLLVRKVERINLVMEKFAARIIFSSALEHNRHL
jgi:hypothetical protein